MPTREAIHRTQLRHADGTFARASAAYLADPRTGMASYGNNEKRTRSVLSVNKATPAISTMLYSGNHVVPVAHDGEYLIGQVMGANTLVRLAPGSTSWELAYTFASGTIQNVWSAANGRLILTIMVADVIYVRYSDDHAGTWTAATRGGSDMTFVTTGANIITDVWSFLQAGDVLFLAEYAGGGSPDARYIYRSLDNGATWTTSYDSGGASAIHHYHCGGYHSATGRVVWVTGDAGTRKFIYTDDWGESWADLITMNEIDIQPTSLVELPDGRMLCGSDRELQLYTINIDGTTATERTIEPVGVEWDRRSARWTGAAWTNASRTYGLHVRRVDGVYYAGAYEALTPAEPVVVSVSADGRRFVPYLKLPLMVAEVACGLRIGPFVHDGQLHLNVTYQTSRRHVICELPRIAETPAVLIEPALASGDNLLDANDGACAAIDNSGQDRYWEDYGNRLTLDSTQGFQGTSCVRETDTDTGAYPHTQYKRINNATGRFVEGDVLALRFWFTGYVAMVQGKWAHFPSGSLTTITNTYEEFWSSWHAPSPATFWQSLIPTPVIAPAVDANPDWKFVVYQMALYHPGYYVGAPTPRPFRDLDLRFDAILATKNMPAVLEWVPGGSARAEDVLTHSVEVDSCWTHVFRVILRNAQWDLRGYGESGAGKIPTLYIQSWYAYWNSVGPEGTKLELYYDVQSATFKLARNSDGSTATITTAAVTFSRETPVVFVVQRYRASDSSARLRFSVLIGGSWYHSTADMTEAASASPLVGTITVRTGGLDGQMAMPMWRTDDSYMYDGLLSIEQLESRVEKALLAASDRSGGGLALIGL